MMTEDWVWLIGFGVLGLILGSFIATLAIRWPAGRSVAQGRSECDSCGKKLSPHELVPVLSYSLQRGKCRACGGRISAAHPICELLGLLVGVTAGIGGPDGVPTAIFGWLLLALAVIDLRAFWLPDALTAPLALCGLVLGIGSIDERLIGGVAGFVALWLVAAGYRRLRKREGLGGGDPKLFGAIGCWLGWQPLPLVLLIACAIGLIIVLALYLEGRKMRGVDRLPLGTLLAPSAYLMWFLVNVVTSLGRL